MVFVPPDELSEKNYRTLKAAFPHGKWVSFLGAGCSVTCGIPGWGAMLNRLIHAKGLDLALSDFDARYPELASEIYRRYEELSCVEDFWEEILTSTEPTTTSYTGLHPAAIAAIPVHITTNFDLNLENAYQDHLRGTVPSCQHFPHFDASELRENTVVYLHADRERKRFVFRKEEYDTYYPSVSGKQDGSRQIESFLRHVFEHFHMLFIGCSFDDRYLTGTFARISRQIAMEAALEERLPHGFKPDRDIRHFALLQGLEPSGSQSEDEARRAERGRLIEELQESHILAVHYRAKQHVDIETILRDLRRAREAAQPVAMPVDRGTAEGEATHVL